MNERIRMLLDGRGFSLSPRERAGVRGKVINNYPT
jgi:hypothetical protein